MIKYALICARGHDFEGWFRNSEAFEQQAERHQIGCPHCGVTDVSKAIMAPAVTSRTPRQPKPAPQVDRTTEAAVRPAPQLPAEVLAVLRALRREVQANTEDVGRSFAEEARKIHNQEAEPRGIRGEATLSEARELLDDGIPFLPLPILPEDKN